MRARARWLAGVAAVAVAAVAVVTITVAARDGEPSSEAMASSSPSAGIDDAPVSAWTPVCGFPEQLVAKVVADRPAGTQPEPLDVWETGDDGEIRGLAVSDQHVVVELDAGGERAEFRFFTFDGEPAGGYTIDVTHEGRWAVADDDSVFVVDSYGESTRRILHFDADGTEVGSFEVPVGSESTGHWLDLQTLTWIRDYRGQPALLVGEGERTVHVVRESGEYLGRLRAGPHVVLGAVGESTVAGYRTSAGQEPLTTLMTVDVDDMTESLHAVFRTTDDTATHDATPAPERLASVVPGPGGDGYLLSTAYGVQWVDPLGIRKGAWMSGQAGFDAASPAALVTRADRYWMLVHVDDRARVAAVGSDEMRRRIATPQLLTDSASADLAQLGLGIGPVTDRPFNHFDFGDPPVVSLRAEEGWGDLSGVDPGRLAVRYTVNGDPTLPRPVAQAAASVPLPWGGGDAELRLPATRPGVYEVNVELVDTASGTALSAACLRYSVGAEGAELNLGDLAPGADWGGAGPLRGVQIADAFGIGSHRVQLDFAGLVVSPTAQPSPEGIDPYYAPGSNLSDDTDADPFQNLREAARYAESHDVDLILQVGSGGDAEKEAVAAGTWEGWVHLLVELFTREAPGVSLWAPWNEPNNNSDLEADDYVEKVEIPFARAAHSAAPGAIVIGGNTLGLDPSWWTQAAGSGLCQAVDAVAVHPYTGWNRSWEEEGYAIPGAGIDEVRAAMGEDCARLPLWDTESGWTGDGAAAFWAQGQNVARKLLWYADEGLAGWTYFFSEGGWGENELSWSLIQHGAYLKPGAATFATVSRLLEGRGRPQQVDSRIPFTYVMRIAGDDTLVAAWTDEARISAVLRTDAPLLDVIDQYGAVDRLPIVDGAAAVTLTGVPQFFRAPAGAEIRFAAAEPFGPDLLAGRPVEASSSWEESDPAVITSGTANPFRPWRSGRLPDGGIDEAPSVTVEMERATTINRIAVASGNIVCCEAGLRHYTVSVQTTDGRWHVVAEPTQQFWERTVVFAFEPTEAIAVRIEVPWTTVRETRVLDVNYTGFAGGLPPPFMGLQSESDYVVAIAAVSAWAPG